MKRKKTAFRLIASLALLAPILACGAGGEETSAGPTDDEARMQARYFGQWRGTFDDEPFELTLSANEVAGTMMPGRSYRLMVITERHMEIEVQTPEGPSTLYFDLSEDGSELRFREELDAPSDAARLRRVEPGAETAAAEAPARGPYASALDTLNELCGDTWCEGENDYRFTALSCGGTTCRLEVDVRQYDEAIDDLGAPRHETLELTGVTAVENEDGATEAFIEKVSVAIDRFEGR
jgi:hypothetical protein